MLILRSITAHLAAAMRGFPGNPVPTFALKASHWAADVIYTPIATEFIKAAAAKGARVLNGAGMCVHQAAEAFRLFTGIEPDVARKGGR
jgi:shikimate dehydrogenase